MIDVRCIYLIIAVRPLHVREDEILGLAALGGCGEPQRLGCQQAVLRGFRPLCQGEGL